LEDYFMRRWILGLAVAVAAAGMCAADDKAEAIVKKAITAHGGAENLNKYKAGRFKMTGEMSIGGLDIEFTGNLAYSMPDRYKMHMSAELMGMKLTIDQVVKGESIKNTVKIGDTVVPSAGDAEKDELKTAAVVQEAEQITPLLDPKKFTIKAADDEDVGGKKAAVIVVQPKAIKKEIRMAFDKETGLLVKTAHKGMGPGNDGTPVEVNEESYGSDYKKVNGVQVPTKIVVNHDGQKFMTIKLTDYELMEKIDDKEFSTDD
jgi:outer membrane lipoprotein-sorting protein